MQLLQCIEVIERIDFDDVRGPKVLEKREKQIVGMMDSTMKEEAAFLFRQMSAMPAARRLSVMPGVRLEDSGEEKDKGTRKKSIMPVSKDEEEEKAMPVKRSSKEARGVGFMELIQYHVES